MGYEYSPLNPLIWLLFLGFCVITYVIVKLFHRRYPDYPNESEKEEEIEVKQRAQTKGKSSAVRWACTKEGEHGSFPQVGRVRPERR